MKKLRKAVAKLLIKGYDRLYPALRDSPGDIQ